MNELPSHAFKNSYCIFVGAYNEKITDYINNQPKSIKLLKANFKDDLFCITIPSHYPFKNIEKDLFALYNRGNDSKGFWGQLGMGYEGKTWSEGIKSLCEV